MSVRAGESKAGIESGSSQAELGTSLVPAIRALFVSKDFDLSPFLEIIVSCVKLVCDYCNLSVIMCVNN